MNIPEVIKLSDYKAGRVGGEKGDYEERDKTDRVGKLEFPVVESLIRDVRKRDKFEAQADLIKWLEDDAVKAKIERPLNFPRIAADRIMRDQEPCRPFIYDVVVEKNKGAYPSDDIFAEAIKEAKSGQMNYNGKMNEGNKLNYFSTAKNDKDVSPTEHIFFTLYLLAKTDEGMHDLATKDEVSEMQLKDLKKIDSLGFVKIVLFYELNRHGAAQIYECYVDGLKIPVERVH